MVPPVGRNRAFILIEVIVALGLAGAITSSLLGLLVYSTRASSSAELMTTGVLLAHSELERIRAELPSLPSTSGKVAVDGWPGFQKQVEITNVGTNLSRVRVTVYWSDWRNKESSVSLETLVYTGEVKD